MKTGQSVEAVDRLISRMVPELSGAIQLELIEKENELDVFEVDAGANGHLTLRGSGAVAMAVGLNWYLKHVCKRHVSWCGTRMDIGLADLKPIAGGRQRIVLPHRRVVYMNYCTFSYSAAWWDWSRWEWELDFMAMNGVNLPLAMVGLEGVWYKALLRMGLTDGEARGFLAGPAFLAWQWMANLEGHGGPLPKSWIESHVELGRRIIGRMRELGMTPIQQGFSGHVPAIFKEKFPSADIMQKESWCNFPGAFQLDPLDPLFSIFGRVFMEEQENLFGLHGYYAADPFHESVPPKPGDEYLRQVGGVIHQLFDAVDPGATWVMQSWSIRKEIACAVPKGRLLVVDLGGQAWTETDGFWGYDFVVGQLHNFGGRINLHGDLAYLAANPFLRARETYPQASGMGLFMEGLTQNPVFYDLAFDLVWRRDPVGLAAWLKGYVERRYGVASAAALRAWGLLLKTVYREGTNEVESSSIIAARPALAVKKSGPNEGFVMPYPPGELAEAWKLLLDARHDCASSDGYRFDLIDVGRQVLSNLGQSLHRQVTAAFEKRELKAFQTASFVFLDLLRDLDALLETRREYRFSAWLTAAQSWGKNEEERELLAKNAAMLVTLWGPEDEPQIFDYSWREWSGLVRDYYLPRWQHFHFFLQQTLEKNDVYAEEGLPHVYGREAWRANAFYASLAAWETAWMNHPVLTPTLASTSDELKVSEVIHEKWMKVV